MKRLANSLQFRLYAVFAAIVVLIIVFQSYTTQIVSSHEVRDQQRIAIAAERTAAYLIITLLHSYIDNESPSGRDSIRSLIDEARQTTSQTQDALRQGDAELDIGALDDSNLLLLLDSMDSTWKTFQDSIDYMLSADQTAWETEIKRVTEKGTGFALYSSRLIEGLETIDTQQQATEHGVKNALTLIIFAALLIATATIVLSVRAINRLAQTAGAFAAGDFKARAAVTSMNEIAQVGQTFNNMAEQIGLLVQDLEQQVAIAQEAQNRAEKADQVKSAFLASVSHELRTPLNAIINFSKFVVKGVMGPVNERQTEALNKVVDSGKHLLNLINDVLDISKIESGALKLFVEENLDVAEIVQQSCALAEGLLEGKPVQLQTEIANDMPRISADRQRLRQIMNNILSNACKFTDEGIIRVSAQERDSAIEIAISDTGPGIAAEDHDLVFESFKQTQTGLRQGTGTGLGMPISRSLAEALGGRLWFESQVGKGATFFVTIPVKSEEKATAVA